MMGVLRQAVATKSLTRPSDPRQRASNMATISRMATHHPKTGAAIKRSPRQEERHDLTSSSHIALLAVGASDAAEAGVDRTRY
jgi:hypothetical protein